ncbi:unnamed protein product [Parajaminaea phylloscopi]
MSLASSAAVLHGFPDVVDDDTAFESFIDEDAVDADSSTPSDDATTAMTSSVEGFTSHHTSLPNTPKLASALSFGPTLNPDGSSSLHDFDIEWDDLSHSHHHHHPIERTSAVSALAFDTAWASSPAARRSAEDIAPSAAIGHDVFDHGDTLHARSLSLSLHDVSPHFLADLKAQAPQTSVREPFIKMEPDAHMAFQHAGPMLPTSFPAEFPQLDRIPMAAVPAGPAGPAMPAMPVVAGPAGADADANRPQEKKRKVEATKSAPARPRKNTGHKKKASQQGAQPPQEQHEQPQQQTVLANVQGGSAGAPGQSDIAVDASPMELAAGANAAPGPEELAAGSAAASSEAIGTDVSRKDALPLELSSAAMAPDVPATPANEDSAAPTAAVPESIGAHSPDSSSVGGNSGSNSSARKPAAKGKKPPPSASQITESGKPFPVIDTSATHSSLFVPPDTSGLTKREARLVKNRAAAFLSRQRKREQFELLEKQCKSICRLTWKMWEKIVGPEAGSEQIGESVLPALLAEEAPDVRDCLEQIVANKGASIAPTEESIANGTHSTADDHKTAGDEASASNQRASPSAGCKREREDDASISGGSSQQQALIEKLREQLGAADKREAALLATLAEERARFAAAAEAQPFYPAMPPNPFAGQQEASNEPSPEQVFREGRSGDTGLSLTEAPHLSAAGVGAMPTPSAGDASARRNLAAETAGAAGATHVAQSSLSAASGKRGATSSMALMVLLFGMALFGSGGIHSASEAPLMGVGRLGPLFGAHSTLGSLFDPLVASTSSQPVAGLLRRRQDEEEAEADQEMTSANDGPAPCQGSSDGVSAQNAEQSASSVAAQMLQDVTDMLPRCYLDDCGPAHAPGTASGGVQWISQHRPLLRRSKSDSSLVTRSRPADSVIGTANAAAAALTTRLQQGLILLGDHADRETSREDGDEEMTDDRAPGGLTGESATPRKLKLFVRRSTVSAVAQSNDGKTQAARSTNPPSPASSSFSDREDVFEDARAKTPGSSSGRSSAGGKPRPSNRVGNLANSFMELEFSLRRQRVVKNEEELASLIQDAARRAHLGGGATFSA